MNTTYHNIICHLQAKLSFGMAILGHKATLESKKGQI